MSLHPQSPALLNGSLVASSAGALTFVGGAADIDQTGQIREEGSCLVQVSGAFGKVAEALTTEGCTLADIVRVKAYYIALDEVDECELLAAISRLLPADPAPVITLQPVVMQPMEGQTLQVQVIAIRGWRERPYEVVIDEVVSVAPTDEHPLSVTVGLRAGEFISVRGQTVGDGELGLSGPEQTRSVMESLQMTLRELGASLADTVKKEGYYGGATMDDWAKMAEVRASFFSEPGPVATVLPWHSPAPLAAATKIEVLAMREKRNGLDKYIPREDSWPARVWDWPIALPYRQGIRLRDLIWIGGQVPWEPHAASGLPMLPGKLVPQTSFVMSYIAEILDGFGRRPADLALLVCHFTSDGSPAQVAAVVDAIAKAVGGPLPPLTLVPQPHMHDADSLVEIWGVARG